MEKKSHVTEDQKGPLTYGAIIKVVLLVKKGSHALSISEDFANNRFPENYVCSYQNLPNAEKHQAAKARWDQAIGCVAFLPSH